MNIWVAAQCGNSKAAANPAIPVAARGCGLTLLVARAYITPASGRMAEWLCNGLQIRVQRFDSASGLHGRSPAPVFLCRGGL